MTLETESSWANAGGTLSVHTHHSDTVAGSMRFAVFTPPQAAQGPVPVSTRGSKTWGDGGCARHQPPRGNGGRR